ALPLDEETPPAERAAALAEMEGLLLSGGADLDPARYGQAPAGAREVESGRDELEWQVWQVARRRGVPVLGICRGFQAVNVFMGGRLVQHVEGHAGAAYGAGVPLRHPLRLAAGSRMARILRPTDPVGAVLSVNSYHHQAVRRETLAPGLVACGMSPHREGDLVEAVESAEPDSFVLAVQCHPERTESTPPEFERLFRVFVDAARGSIVGRRVG
ncbi:MAG TPA: gamma-glutamyl-gamma-aminobutyrate hydrolase family protein, partial [Candidatus Limnocylindrales bacterium]|nr:gamma-glutamyl-gamma-aminobutyrate hydrolase family protein [Candidatus Limnocylindrales bacterium]